MLIVSGYRNGSGELNSYARGAGGCKSNMTLRQK